MKSRFRVWCFRVGVLGFRDKGEPIHAGMKGAIYIPDRSLRDLGLSTSSGFRVAKGSIFKKHAEGQWRW